MSAQRFLDYVAGEPARIPLGALSVFVLLDMNWLQTRNHVKVNFQNIYSNIIFIYCVGFNTKIIYGLVFIQL